MRARRGLQRVGRNPPGILQHLQRLPQTHTVKCKSWDDIRWRTREQQICRLQQRIYRASQEGETRTVHTLQQQLLVSEAARLLAVRRVAQDNEGKDTAGVDGVKSLTPAERLTMADAIHPSRWREQPPRPVRRVWIPKPGAMEKRPLGILPMIDRCKQALVKLALEPEWEARFEPHSYGFRPGRSPQDAIRAVVQALEQQPCFVLDADIEGAFEHVNQAALLEKLHTFPALRKAIHAWLTTGIVDGSAFLPSDEGIVQGGVLSPLLLNIALHGMEEAVTGTQAVRHHLELPLLIRYADDLVVLHSRLDELQQATDRLRQWLLVMGLQLNERKTRITHTLTPFQGQAGFDFLGFMLRQYPTERLPGGSKGVKTIFTRWLTLSQPQPRFKTVVTPSDEASKRHLALIGHRLLMLRSAPQAEVIRSLNPLIGGWSAYYREVVEPAVMGHYDEQLERLLVRWAQQRHTDKGRDWLIERYWQHADRHERVFATPDGRRLCEYQRARRS